MLRQKCRDEKKTYVSIYGYVSLVFPSIFRYFRLTDDDKLEIKFDSIIREEEVVNEEIFNTQVEQDEEEENADKDTDTRWVKFDNFHFFKFIFYYFSDWCHLPLFLFQHSKIKL